jgi:3-deoxy-D-manno-octulosonic-acid transferase
MTLARLAYSSLLRLATPAYLARLWWRGRREPAYREAVAQRLGWGYEPVAPGALWVHAVSLGETLAAQALVDALRQQRPGLRLLLTHGTATGRAAGQKLLRPGDMQTWLPYDTPGAVHRFLCACRPAVGVLMETEVWPNLLLAAQQAAVPMVLANARLSERSARKGQRFGALLRLRDAGVSDVRVAGNLKFDLQPDPEQQTLGRSWRHALGRPVLALANSREGEEAMLLAAWQDMPRPRPLLLIVPRHPQRFEAVAQLVASAGWRLARRSQWGEQSPAEAAQADVWLGDSLGEMALYYSLADVALLGGSFAPLGGHNLIEASANGCPIVLGPSTFNFALAAELALAAGAAWQAQDLNSGLRLALACLNEPGSREAASTCALAFAASHQGASQRMAQAIVALLP